jgi:Helix-turn-helix domain
MAKAIKAWATTNGAAGDDNLPLRAAARRLGVSHHTLRSWAVHQHRLPYRKLGGKVLLFRVVDLVAFEAKHLVPARPPRQV